MIDWDDAFDNSGYVSGSDNLASVWFEKSIAFKEKVINDKFSRVGTRYGNKKRNLVDLFSSNKDPEIFVLFVHGGYWHQLGKDYWSFLADGIYKKNMGFAILNYSLAPDVSISEISEDILTCINFLSEEVHSRFVLVGHSAGGHLVTKMNSKPEKFQTKVRGKIIRTISISGIYDLRPLLNTRLNETLGLDNNEANSESPALLEPIEKSDLIFCVGSDERPEFLRQTGLIFEKWKNYNINSKIHFEKNTNHFSVIETILDQNSFLFKQILGR